VKLSGWVERWNHRLTRFLERRVRSPVDAQDLAQEVYLRLLRVERLDLIEQPEAYLYRVARNIAMEWRMRASQSRPHAADELDALVDLTTPETLTQEAVNAHGFESALRSLKSTERAIVFLKLRDDMTHEEIARHLGITPRMVRRHLANGYAKLRRRLVTESVP
jgi:RNA polymerase sigma-70 factor (ECF subfamily)